LPIPAREQSKFTKSANKSKKNLYKKIQYGYKKNAEFHADCESIEKVMKKCTKKLLAKM
jgi:hypothetical protein